MFAQHIPAVCGAHVVGREARDVYQVVGRVADMFDELIAYAGAYLRQTILFGLLEVVFGESFGAGFFGVSVFGFFGASLRFFALLLFHGEGTKEKRRDRWAGVVREADGATEQFEIEASPAASSSSSSSLSARCRSVRRRELRGTAPLAWSSSGPPLRMYVIHFERNSSTSTPVLESPVKSCAVFL